MRSMPSSKDPLLVPLFEVLDFCDTARTAASRQVTSVAPQALSLFNGDFVNRQSRHFARRLEVEAGPDAGKQVERAYLMALCRPVSAREKTEMLEFLKREAEQRLKERGRNLRLPTTRARVVKRWSNCAGSFST